MLKDELLKEYEKDVKNLRKCAKQLSLSDREISRIFKQCFKLLKDENQSSKLRKTQAQKFLRFFKIIVLSTTIIVFIYVILNVHQTTSSIVLRNVQVLIYPGLKVLRSLSVPIIRIFPQLTDYYDESCLVENPYFYVSDMECWPCESVHSVIDLTGFDNHSLYQSGIPYIVKTNQKRITLEALQNVYKSNESLLESQTSLKSTHRQVHSLADLFPAPPPSSHSVWRINKMAPARLIRQLFPRPYIISEWSGQSIERYVMVDGPQASQYALPSMECSYIFVVQASGERTIILKPSKECSNCRTVSVVLKTGFVLWYNWWYWRPISLPSENATQFSVSYVSSYC